MKAAILEKLKDDEAKQIGSILVMIGPLFLLSVNGNVNFKFEDFDDLRENPMMAPFMVTYSDLLEGMLGTKPSDMVEATNGIDVSQEKNQIKEDDGVGAQKDKAAFQLIYQIFKTLGDMSDDGEIKFNLLWPDIGVLHFHIKSAGLKDVLKVPLSMVIQ